MNIRQPMASISFERLVRASLQATPHCMSLSRRRNSRTRFEKFEHFVSVYHIEYIHDSFGRFAGPLIRFWDALSCECGDHRAKNWLSRLQSCRVLSLVSTLLDRRLKSRDSLYAVTLLEIVNDLRLVYVTDDQFRSVCCVYRSRSFRQIKMATLIKAFRRVTGENFKFCLGQTAQFHS